MTGGVREGCEERRRRWEHHISEWRRSGVTQAFYCRRYGLRLKSFGYWLRKTRRKETTPQLVEICLKDSAPVASSLHLYVGDRYRVDIQSGFDPETLEQVLRILR